MKLTAYNKKRRFDKTDEPRGKIFKLKSPKRIYTIQKHAARRLHYDLRLEYNGVLKSWAIPKGPSLNPNNKRLAVAVEDHPYDYATFEGIIPKGEYGAGTVLLWDQGFWYPEGDVNKGLKEGKLVFTLEGKKLQGKWTLIRIHTTDATKKNWLLIKLKDDKAHFETKKSIVETKPQSILDPSHQSAKIIELSSKRKTFLQNIHPELATLVSKAPEGNNWLHEVKFDGYRIICQKFNGQTHLYTRNQLDWTTKISFIAQQINKMTLDNFILDGEVVAIDKQGQSDFQQLQNVLKASEKFPLIYYVFDILYFEREWLLDKPLIERKAILKKALSKKNSKNICYVDFIRGYGEQIFQAACEHKLEGIVSKRDDSHYVQKRTLDWVKTKCHLGQEFIIGGYTKPGGERKYFGSLLLGYYDNNHHLIYCGHVGTGFTQKTLKEVFLKIRKP